MKRKINCESARAFPIEKALAKLGHFPQKTAEKEAWFLSPFRSETQDQDIPEYTYSASLDEIRKKDYSLVPSKYIAFLNRDEQLDYDTQMQTLQVDLIDLFEQENTLKQEVANVFKELGYEL